MIINLTQHAATDAQKEQGVVDLPGLSVVNGKPVTTPGSVHARLVELLTFDAIPTAEEMRARAADIAELACHNGLGDDDGEDPPPAEAMIGGAPYFQSALEQALLDRGVEPVYAFSTRQSMDTVQKDGTVKKVQVFEHVGFVRPF
jgi:hypothetical protein